MSKFRKKPVVIEARQVVGSPDGAEVREVAQWCGGRTAGLWSEPSIYITTLEGEMRADPGDWVIKGVQGEFYPCKDSIFAATYEPVED